MERFERIGNQIMNRDRGGGSVQADPLSGVLGDPVKRRPPPSCSARPT